MTLKEIIIAALKQMGADGVVNPDIECGCGIDEICLMDCPNLNECHAAKYRLCSECEFNGDCSLQNTWYIYDINPRENDGCYCRYEKDGGEI